MEDCERLVWVWFVSGASFRSARSGRVSLGLDFKLKTSLRSDAELPVFRLNERAGDEWGELVGV